MARITVCALYFGGMMVDAFRTVRDFEKAISEYTGAPYVVAVNSCTMALLLAFRWYFENGGESVNLPSVTYPSVYMSAHYAGLRIESTDFEWDGVYCCYPSRIWDCAKRFTGNMYIPGQVQCVSFHIAKHLKLGQGGAILHNDVVADRWYRLMRFDGRTEGVATKDDEYSQPGYHCYMSPDVAARGLWLMQSYPKYVPDQEMHDYPDMSRWFTAWQR
jgi:dTDP-4-amino-4,6-dideoxygalactose transaminase